MLISPPESNPVISLADITKFYGIPYDFSGPNLLKFLQGKRGAFRRISDRPALKGVTLQVKKGELLGVIGRNGAGKSTLLKVISGVSKPNEGKMRVSGRLFPMIELNAGMNPRFSGRENVQLLAAIMNVGKKTIEARMAEIEEFCDLGDHFDRPVRTYSSGMPGRLGFAVAVHADADIVLIDEVLAVGDVAFRNRCTAKMEELRDSGKTLVLVSHNMQAISTLCSRTIVLEQGEIKFNGPTAGAIQYYGDLMAAYTARKIQRHMRRPTQETKSDRCEVWGLKILNGRNEEMPVVNPRKVLRVIFSVFAADGIEEGLAFIRIEAPDSLLLVEERVLVSFSNEEFNRRLVFEFQRGVPMKTGRHRLTVGILDRFGELVLASLEHTMDVETEGRSAHGLIAPLFKLYVSDEPKGRPRPAAEAEKTAQEAAG